MNINLKKLSKNIFYVIKFIIMLFSFKITLIILFFFFNDYLINMMKYLRYIQNHKIIFVLNSVSDY